MAEDSSAPDLSGKVLDVDELEVDIVILAKMPNALKQTASFLTRRGWPTHVFSNVSKMIEVIAERRPDIIMVSLNHPSPAVLKLPDVIVQTFNLICIGFVELNDPNSTNKLSSRKIRHKIFGTPSGPNISRGIRRILAEKYNIKLDDHRKDEVKKGKAKGNNGLVLQKSGQGVTDSNGVKVNVGAEESETANTKVVAETSEPAVEAQTPTEVEVEATTEVESPTSVADGPIANPNKKRVRLKELLGIEISDVASGNMYLGDSMDQNAEQPKPQAPGNGSEEDPSDLVGRLKKSLFGDGPEEVEDNSGMANLEKASGKALAKVCQKGEAGKKISKLVQVSKVGVFPVVSETMPGYLVVGMTANSQGFLKVCETSLQQSFNSMGVVAKVEPGFWIDIPEVQFDEWSMACASFTFKVENLGAEVGVAFFPSDRPLPKVQPISGEDMVSVAVADISTEEPVSFKAYIYLKENDKYYLYLRNGRQLQPEQKQRLEDKNISEFHMKAVDQENLRMFFAASHLKETIKAIQSNPEDDMGDDSDTANEAA